MKYFLVKGRVKINGHWQSLSVSHRGYTPEEAIAKAKYKYDKAETVIVESVYEMVWQHGVRLK